MNIIFSIKLGGSFRKHWELRFSHDSFKCEKCLTSQFGLELVNTPATIEKVFQSLNKIILGTKNSKKLKFSRLKTFKTINSPHNFFHFLW